MLYIFVEGPDDERFLKKLFDNSLEFRFITYANLTNQKIKTWVQSISKIPNSHYVFLADSDGKTANDKSDSLTNKYPFLESQNIYIVIFEIESWYLAGVTKQYSESNKFKKFYTNTDAITKEQFEHVISSKKDSRVVTMINILENYDWNEAKSRNSSLRSFLEKMKVRTN